MKRNARNINTLIRNARSGHNVRVTRTIQKTGCVGLQGNVVTLQAGKHTPARDTPTRNARMSAHDTYAALRARPRYYYIFIVLINIIRR